jgi:muramoyltetrapeptide carboxypeptidase
MCLRGGYGSQRLLSLLDLKPCAQSGKPLIGFSDITALLGVFARFGGWAIHGPMAGSLVSDASVSHFSRDHLKAALFEPDRERSVREGYDHAGETIEVARTGTVSGRLIGGNLTILTSLLGTPWFPSLKGAILFIEDVGEAPYRIDRMVTHLINSGVLAGVRGIAAGLFASCDAVDATGEPQPPGWRRVIQERLLPLKVPLVLGLPFGHVPFNAALPVGQTATLDAKRGDLIVGGRMMRVGLRRVK